MHLSDGDRVIKKDTTAEPTVNQLTALDKSWPIRNWLSTLVSCSMDCMRKLYASQQTKPSILMKNTLKVSRKEGFLRLKKLRAKLLKEEKE